MVIVTFANFIAIFIALAGRLIRKERISFLIAIIFLILFYSIRTDYGNDLPTYMESFEKLSNFQLSYVNDNDDRYEPGWLTLNILFAPFGWQAFITFLTIIQFGTIYWLITKYVNAKYFWLIFALYVLNSNLLLTDLSMLRQALAMHIVTWSIPLILDKKFFKAGIIILGASTIHTSAYAALLLLFFSLIKNINAKVIVICFLSIFVLLTAAESLVGDVLKIVFHSENFERYDYYSGDKVEGGMGLGVMLRVVICAWLLLNYSKTKESLFFNYAYALCVLTIPFSLSVQMIARIGMYFDLIGIVALQNLMDKKQIVSIIFLMILFYISFLGYFAFFEIPIWKPYFSVYNTIFD